MADDERKFRRRERKNRWMAHYALKYGLQPSQWGGSVVVRAQCRFCESFGREGPSTSANRRKKRRTLKTFGPNFRTDNLESHLWREHPSKWRAYELRKEEKEGFFPSFQEDRNAVSNRERDEDRNVNAEDVGRSSFDSTRSGDTSLLSPVSESSDDVTGARAELRIEASGAVWEVLEQLLGLKTAGSTLQPFVFEDSESDVDRENWLDEQDSLLTSEPLLLYFADLFRAGLDMDAVLAVLRATKQLQPLLDPAKLLTGGDSVARVHVVRAVRQLMALNLSTISTLTASLWGFSMVLHFSTMRSDFAESSGRGGLLEVRLQLPVDGELQQVHLVTLPLSFAHVNETGASGIGAAIVRVLCAVDSRAMEKLVGVTVDGDPFEVGVLAIGVARWLRSQAQLAVTVSGASNGSIATFYIRPSATFLLSLVIEDALAAFQREFSFISSLAGIDAVFTTNKALRELLVSDTNPFTLGTVRTRKQASSASPLLRTHWIRVSAQCEWLVMHRETLLQWQCDHCNDADAKLLTPALASNLFWVLVFLFRDLLNDLEATLVHCEHESASYSDVQRHLRDYLSQLRLKFNVKATDASSQVSLASNSFSDGENTTTSLSYQAFVNAIIPLDLFVYEAFQLKSIEGIGDTERESIFTHFSRIVAELQSNLESVVATSATASESRVGEASTTSATTVDSSITFRTLKQDCNVVPPSTPYELMALSNLAFMELLNGHQARLRARWSGKMLTQITSERNRLVFEIANRSALYEQQKSGKDAWGVVRVEYPTLSSFVPVFGAHLAVSKPAAVLIRAEFVGSASTITLEAQLHAQQLRKLVTLGKQLEDTA